MDKYEYNLKLDEIKKLVTGGNYEDAAKVADSIEWKRVRNTRTLCMISEIYEANGRLEDSKEILLRAYRRSQMTRTVLFRLTEVAIKMKEFDEAVEYYSEFVNAAPNDTSRYILKYEIYKGRGSSLEDQIAILEEYKEIEYTEQWGYELAKLYYQAGEKRKCIECCDDLVLWFRQGKYVIKALELKKSLTDLTPVQRSIYEHRDENLMPIQERVEAAVPELEKIILDKMPNSEMETMTDNIISETQRELAEAISQHAAEVNLEIPDESWRYNTGQTEGTKVIPTEEVKEAREAVIREEAILDDEPEEEPVLEEEPIVEEQPKAEPVKKVMPKAELEMPDLNNFHVEEPMIKLPKEEPAPVKEEKEETVPEFDTLQLQRELAESMREIISGINRRESDEDIVEPKNDMSYFKHSQMEIPKTNPGASIDDILLSMSGVQEPVQEPEVVQNVAPVQEPEAPQNVAPVQEPEAPQNAAPVQQPVTPQNAAPVQQPTMPQNAAPVQQPVMPQNAAPVQQPTMPQNTAPVQNQAHTQNMVGVVRTQRVGTASNAAQGLTLNQQQLFSYFSTIQGLREQIASALNEAIHKVKQDKTSRSGNLVITGDPGSGRTTLAIRFAKALSMERGSNAARVAKIYAEDLNKKDIASTVAKIAGGTLIIEEAGDLDEEVIAQLSKAMEFRTDGLLVILEDEKSYLKEIFEKYPAFAEKFTSEISIPIMTNDELVTFGKIYAYDEDYRIDDSALVALYNRIGAMQTPDHPVCIADVRDIVDEAIHRSERGGFRKLGMILSKKRYDDDDRVILYEKDFK